MSSSEQPCYTLIHVPNDVEFPTENQLREKFEKGKCLWRMEGFSLLRAPFTGDTKAKTETLKKLILMIQSGEKINQHLIMYVIRFCLPTTDHYLKKLLLVFWEVVPKVSCPVAGPVCDSSLLLFHSVQTNAEGKLLHEMILVCDAYRKDLQHPNEYIRGSTLR